MNDHYVVSANIFLKNNNLERMRFLMIPVLTEIILIKNLKRRKLELQNFAFSIMFNTIYLDF